MDVTLDAKKVVAPDYLPVQALAFRVLINNGVATAKPLTLSLIGGGTVAGELAIDAQTDLPKVRAALKGTNIELGMFFRNSRYFDTTQGKIQGQVSLAGSGKSLAQVMSVADGHVEVALTGGSVSSLMVSLAGLQLFDALILYVTGDNRIPILCALGRLNFQHGTVIFDRTLLDTQKSILHVSRSGRAAKPGRECPGQGRSQGVRSPGPARPGLRAGQDPLAPDLDRPRHPDPDPGFRQRQERGLRGHGPAAILQSITSLLQRPSSMAPGRAPFICDNSVTGGCRWSQSARLRWRIIARVVNCNGWPIAGVGVLYWILDRSGGRGASDFETVLLTSRQVNDARSSDNCPRRPRLHVLLHEHGKVRATADRPCHFQRALRQHARACAVHRFGRAVRDALRGKGFEVMERSDLGRGEFDTSIGALARRLAAAPAASGALYYCGYALEFNGRSFLLPASASIARDYDVLTQGIIAKSLVDSLVRGNESTGFVLLDVFRTPAASSTAGLGGLAEQIRPSNFAVIGASNDGAAEGPTAASLALRDQAAEGEISPDTFAGGMRRRLAKAAAVTAQFIPAIASFAGRAQPRDPSAPASPRACRVRRASPFLRRRQPPPPEPAVACSPAAPPPARPWRTRIRCPTRIAVGSRRCWQPWDITAAASTGHSGLKLGPPSAAISSRSRPK